MPKASRPSSEKPTIKKQMSKYNRFTPASRQTNKVLVAIFVALFAGVGWYLLFVSHAATMAIASIEAETMILPTGASTVTDTTASNSSAIKLNANGTASGSINLPSAGNSLAISAKGTQCKGAPTMTLTVDNVSVGSAVSVTATSWTAYNFTKSLAAGPHTIAVSFTNYSTWKNCAKALFIDKVTFMADITPAPAITLGASPTAVASGTSSTLTWSTTNANSCTASGAWSGSQPVSGTHSTGVLSTPSTYTLSCTGSGGTTNSSVTVTVTSSTPSPQISWTTCGNGTLIVPMSSSAAATLVTHQPETRPYNARNYTIGGIAHIAANNYVPTDAEISNFRTGQKDSSGRTNLQTNPYSAYVDGRPGLSNPSTDDLIQWAAHKWGIPEDWLRAQYVNESYWSQYGLGDRVTENATDYPLFPVQSRVPNTNSDVYESMGITQVKWRPNGSASLGTEPVRWESTAFNIDYQASAIRFYYDNPNNVRSAWGDTTYKACDQWNSIGGWFQPYPWGNSGQQTYVANVQNHLSQRTWTTSSFLNWTPSNLPTSITFQ